MEKKTSIIGKAGFIGLILILTSVLGAYAGYLSYTGPNGSYAWSSTENYCIRAGNNSYNLTFADMQKACDLKGLIEFPECNISVPVGSTLQVYGGTELIGKGNKTILYSAGGTGNFNILNVTTGSKNVLIQGIKFDCNNVSNSGTYACGIWLKPYTRNITIDRCYFTRIEWCGINQESSYTTGNATVENCQFDRKQHGGYGSGCALRGSNNIFRNNRISDMWAAGIVVEGGSFTTKNIIEGNNIQGPCSVGIYSEASGNSRGTLIANNVVSNINCTAYAGSPDGIGILATNNCTITGNIAINCSRGGIKIEGFDSTVTGNIINDCGEGYLGGYGISIEGANCTITGNIISITLAKTYDRPDWGITTGGGCIISGNTITAEGSIKFDQGIKTTDKNCTIDNNKIYGATLGIQMESSFSKITGNTLVYCGIGYPAIYLTGTTFNIVSNNEIIGASRGIRLLNTFNTTVTLNIISATTATYGIYEGTSADFNTIAFNNMLRCATPATSITILKATGNSSALFNQGCYKTMWTHLMANPVAGAQWVNTTTGKIGTYSGAAWLWT